MKLNRILILLLVLVTVIQANPRHRYKKYPRNHHNYYRSYQPYHYNYLRFSYGPRRYYSPVVISTVTKTVYPKNLVVLTANDVADDVKALNNLFSRDLISEKDYERSKKTLLNRIGMTVNPNASEASIPEIIDQIELLHEMKTKELITEREYRKQKKKLLAMI